MCLATAGDKVKERSRHSSQQQLRSCPHPPGPLAADNTESGVSDSLKSLLGKGTGRASWSGARPALACAGWGRGGLPGGGVLTSAHASS